MFSLKFPRKVLEQLLYRVLLAACFCLLEFFSFSEPATVKPGTCNKATLSKIRSSLSAIVRTLSRLIGASGDEINDETSESSVQDEH